MDNCNSGINAGNGGGIVIIRAGNFTADTSSSISRFSQVTLD